MEALWAWGLEVIHAVQAAGGPALDALVRAVTFLGDEEFLVVFLALLYWCVDCGWGLRLGIAYLLPGYLTEGLKGLFAHPRPYVLDPAVQLVDAGAMEYGLPSNHSQAAVVLWGIVAGRVRRAWVWAVAVVMIVLIGFSRVYLGVHFPSDVLAGWALGGVFLLLYLWLGKRFEGWLARAGLAVQLALAVALPPLLALVYPTRATITLMGALMGLGSGAALGRRLAPFSPAGRVWQRAARFAAGVVPLAGLYLGLRAVFPGEGEPFYAALRFLRYALVGLWAGLGAPWLFLRLRLASTTRA